MALVIVSHARQRMYWRGVTEAELVATLEQGTIAYAHSNRQAREMVFAFESTWRGRFHPQKRVRVVFVEDGDDTVVITVYAYYGRWEEP